MQRLSHYKIERKAWVRGQTFGFPCSLVQLNGLHYKGVWGSRYVKKPCVRFFKYLGCLIILFPPYLGGSSSVVHGGVEGVGECLATSDCRGAGGRERGREEGREGGGREGGGREGGREGGRRWGKWEEGMLRGRKKGDINQWRNNARDNKNLIERTKQEIRRGIVDMKREGVGGGNKKGKGRIREGEEVGEGGKG